MISRWDGIRYASWCGCRVGSSCHFPKIGKGLFLMYLCWCTSGLAYKFLMGYRTSFTSTRWRIVPGALNVGAGSSCCDADWQFTMCHVCPFSLLLCMVSDSCLLCLLRKIHIINCLTSSVLQLKVGIGH